MKHETRTVAHHLLWLATGDPGQLQQAHRCVVSTCENAPEEDRSSMLENVPLYRDILRAWNEVRVEEDRP